MPVVCPTITAEDTHDYRSQMELVEPFARRIHIDLMDGQFAPSRSPDLAQAWWGETIVSDIHLMYKYPEQYLDTLISLKPSLVVFHFEAEVDHARMSSSLRNSGIKAGLALLQDTSIETVQQVLPYFDHVLVFSGHLGYHGGEADLSLLGKVKQLKELGLNLEIAWDGGINDQNAQALIEAGVDVLNVGGFIHNATDPANAYAKLEALVG